MTQIKALKTPLIAIALLALILLPADLTGFGIPWSGFKRYGLYILSLWLVTAIAAMGVNLIVGYAGQETLAQAAFLGIGAFTSALLLKAGYPFFLAFVASGALAFLVGIALGFPALRVQKHYLAFVTLAFTVFMWLFIRNEDWLTGGVSGMDVKRPVILGINTKPGLTFYYLMLSFTAALTFAAVVDLATVHGVGLSRLCAKIRSALKVSASMSARISCWHLPLVRPTAALPVRFTRRWWNSLIRRHSRLGRRCCSC